MNWTSADLYTNFTTAPELKDHVKISLLAFNFLFGLLTHPYVLWLIVTGPKSKITFEFFTLNLSVCEIGNSLNSLIFLLSQVFLCLSILVPFVQGLATTGRPLFQCLICVERYLAVVHPVTFLKSKPLRYRLICCIAAWIITLCACFICWFTLTLVNFQSYILFFSLQFLLFLSIQLFCLVAVLRALKQSGPGDRKRGKEENHMKRRAFYLILITTFNVAVVHVPYIIASLYTTVTQSYGLEHWNAALACYVLASFVQPVLYLHRAGRLPCSS